MKRVDSLKFLTSFILIFSSAMSIATASDGNAYGDTTEFLIEFHRNPKKVMNTPLPKWDEDGNPVLDSVSPFGEKVSRSELLLAKNKVREVICRAAGRPCVEPEFSHFFAAPSPKNQVTDFLYEPDFMKSLLEIEKAGLREVALPKHPWSESYWPTAKGGIARRWQDSSFPGSDDWTLNFMSFQSKPSQLMPIDLMAPSEKYDLLTGSTTFPLTNAMWAEGKTTLDELKKVPIWHGLCHGWGPASFMTPNPVKTVLLKSPSGQLIKFFPSDIKALASRAWGESPPEMRYAGERCNNPAPKEDEVGRVQDDNCFDVNPATWHLAIVNQIGVEKRSFLFDSVFDLQVWNYPVYAYRYDYFNPQTFSTSKDLAGSVVKLEDYTIDKFRSYRSPDARSVVGISMIAYYIDVGSPSTKPVTELKYKSIKYVYDLELDAKGAIVGGEWYSNFHPDFLWHPVPDSHPISIGEKLVPGPHVWNGVGPLPSNVQGAVAESSPKGEVVSTIVETLIRLSQ